MEWGSNLEFILPLKSKIVCNIGIDLISIVKSWWFGQLTWKAFADTRKVPYEL